MSILNWNQGEILFVNVKTRSAIVLDEVLNRPIEVPLDPISRDDDTSFSGVEFIPKEGAKVKLYYKDHVPYILGAAPYIATTMDVDQMSIRKKLTNVNIGDIDLNGLVSDDLPKGDGYRKVGKNYFGSSDPMYRKTRGQFTNYSGNSFEDLLPGDKVLTTKDGNAVGVLEGGVTYLKASELCQIIGIKYNDLLRIVSRNFEHFTDFGNIYSKNIDGATSYIIEGAASQSQSRMNQHTIKIEVGAQGDLYKVTTSNGANSILSMFHMTNKGDIKYISHGESNLTLGDKLEKVTGKKTVRVQGNYEEQYDSDVIRGIKGTEVTTIQNNRNITVKNDDINLTGRNQNVTIGGLKDETIGGSPTMDDAFTQNIGIGNKKETIKTTGNFKRDIVVMGNFLESTTLGDFKRDTLGGNFEDTTALGDLKRTTYVGNIADKTSMGNLTRTTSKGDILDLASCGDYALNVLDLLGMGGNITIMNKKSYIYMSKSGNITIDNGPTTITIKSGGDVEIDMGGDLLLGGAAFQKAVLGDLFMTYFNMHNHGTGVGPSSIPLIPMTTALLSSCVKVKI